MNIKLSIIMPAFNSEKYIRQAVNSILNQTFSDFELLVVNDASQDDTLNILKSFTDYRLKILDNPVNCGPYYSRNAGMFHSRGEYIAFVDSDDLSSPNRFQKILSFLESNRNIFHVETRYMRFYENTNDIWIRDWSRGVGPAVLRREVMDDIGFFLPVKAGGDSEYADRILKYYGKEKTHMINDFTYWAIQRSDSLTSTIPSKGTERIEFQTYTHEIFHKSNNLYVEFPFSTELLLEFKKIKLFSKSSKSDIKKINVTEGKGQPLGKTKKNELEMLLDFSEQCNKEFYSNYLRLKADNLRLKAEYDKMPKWWKRISSLIRRFHK